MNRLEKYPKYKDSGVEWIGDIPEHWEVTRLANIGIFSASGIDKHTKKNESKVKIVNFTDIFSNINATLDTSIKYMVVSTPEENRVKNLLQKGDLVFLPSSETYEDLGLSALVNEELDNTAFSYHVIRFQFKYDVYHSFRKYLTNNHSVLSHFIREGKGTTRKIIGRNVFRNTIIVFPPKQEQIKIANYLDKKTAQIDKAITLKEQLIEKLKERRQVLINDAVTKGLDKNVKMKDSGVEWIGEIPEGWEVEKGKRLFRQIKRPVRIEDEIITCFRDGEVTLRKNRRIDGFTNALKEHGYQGIRKGDLVIHNMDAFAGAIGISDSDGKSTPVYSVCIPWNENTTLPEYYAYYLRHLAVQGFILSLAKGIRERSTDFRFNDFGELLFPVPPKEVQIDIMDYVNDITKKTQQVISLYQKQIEKLKEYKSTLIDSVVTGKVRVS
jgi:type I restriction enzyme S subunit